MQYIILNSDEGTSLKLRYKKYTITYTLLCLHIYCQLILVYHSCTLDSKPIPLLSQDSK